MLQLFLNTAGLEFSCAQTMPLPLPFAETAGAVPGKPKVLDVLEDGAPESCAFVMAKASRGPPAGP